SGNAAGGDGGGLYNTGGVLVVGSTITNNRADKDSNGRGIGGGVWNDPVAVPILMANTIVAGNFAGAGTDRDDISGTLDPAGASFNLIGVDANLTLVNDG